jgi:hypothetical protein
MNKIGGGRISDFFKIVGQFLVIIVVFMVIAFGVLVLLNMAGCITGNAHAAPLTIRGSFPLTANSGTCAVPIIAPIDTSSHGSLLFALNSGGVYVRDSVPDAIPGIEYPRLFDLRPGYWAITATPFWGGRAGCDTTIYRWVGSPWKAGLR